MTASQLDAPKPAEHPTKGPIVYWKLLESNTDGETTYLIAYGQEDKPLALRVHSAQRLPAVEIDLSIECAEQFDCEVPEALARWEIHQH
jgi:hypothetical protein